MPKRETPQLNLQSELPEVVSRDFNLFYKPEPKPIDPSIETFTKSLDNFINQGGTALAISKEKEVKQESETEAIQVYNDTRLKFNDLVNSGKLPKEANPYFIDKYKELELGDKSRAFKTYLNKKYVELGVKENTNPDAFPKFYNDSIKEFFKDNQLGFFEPMLLKKGFFEKTDKIRDEMFNQHSNAQLAKLGENYKKSFKNNIQGFFEDDGTPNNFKNIGANISAFIKDKTLNGLSNESAREYLLEALKEYASKTNDFDFARKILAEVPKHIVLGTDSLANVKGLKEEFNEIEDALLDREVEFETRQENLSNANFNKEKRFIRARVDGEGFDPVEFKKGSEYQSLSKRAKEYYEIYYQKGSTAFATNDNKVVTDKLEDLIKNNKYQEAEDYLLEVGSSQLREITYNNYFKKISIFAGTETDKKVNGYLNIPLFKFYKDDVEDKLKEINKNGTVVDVYLAGKFEQDSRQWLFDNKDKYENPSDFESAFKKYITEEYKILKNILSGGSRPTKTESFNPEKLNNKSSSITSGTKTETADLNKINKKTTRKERRTNKPTDPELEIDLSKVVVIPEGMSGAELRKFRRNNSNAITKEEYDRIAQKQLTNNLAKQASNETTGGST